MGKITLYIYKKVDYKILKYQKNSVYNTIFYSLISAETLVAFFW